MMRNRILFVIMAVSAALLSLTGCRKPTASYGNLQGRVTTLSTGEPLYGVSVVYGDSAVYTDLDGAYLYADLPDGLQGVWFRMDGYYEVMRQVNIPAGGTTECNVSLDLVLSGWAAGAGDSGYGTILRTTDAGRSWVRQGSTAMVPDVRLTDVCAVSDQVCWIGGEADTSARRSVLLKTEDGGTTWVNQGSSLGGLPPVSISAVVAMDGDTAWAVSSDTCVVLKTVNGGSSWSICRESASVQSYSAITTMDGKSIWCCGSGLSGGVVVDYSPDGGNTWSEFNVPAAYELQQPTDICAVPGPVVYIAGTNTMGVLVSRDGGSSWTQTVSSDVDLLSLDLYGESYGWACGAGGRLYLSTDGFSTSRNLSPVPAYSDGVITSVSFLRDGKRGALSVVSSTGATGAVYFTEDGGDVWNESSLPFEFSIESVDFVGGAN